MSSDIHGSIVAIVTPMNPDGSLDYPALNNLLQWHIESGTNAVVVVGTTGESATLSNDEHCDLVAHCVKQVAGRIPVIILTKRCILPNRLKITALTPRYWLRLITIDPRKKVYTSTSER